MEKVSLLIGKPIISIYNAEIVGTIKNIIFDKKYSKIKWLVFFDEKSENDFLIGSKDVYAINDVITIKNNDCIINKNIVELEENNPINFLVFSVDGKQIGKINDITFDKNFKNTCFQLVDNTTFTANEFLNIGKNIAIIKTGKHKKLSDYKSKSKIMTKNLQKNSLVKIENNEQTKITSPKKILTDNYNFLIGRKLDKNIYAENKQIIAKKQTTITSHIIDIASQNGKLKELTNSSITN